MKITLFFILSISLLLLSSLLFAQHNIVYRDHHLHQVLVNPATAGSEYIPTAAISYRKQWAGISNSPFSLIASSSLRLGNFDFYNPKMMINKSHFKSHERMGLGVGLYADQNGPVGSKGINLAYAYHIKLKHSSLSFGLSINVEQSQLKGTSWTPVDPNDPLLQPLKDSYYSFNANSGVYYCGAEYFVGLAVNHLLPLDNKLDPGEKVKQDYILNGGYMFRSKEPLKIEPSLNLRYLDYDTFEYDVRAKVYIQHIHWVSLSYRSYKALSLAAGMRINRFYLAYDFELNLSSIVKYSAGTHGIHLGINLGMRGFEGF